ncbi:MAG: CtsR family transcriptional regulator [Solibacillus sp.]
MRNISDIIEGYLKDIIESKGQGHIEIRRSEIAEKFQCVPSQINYVINTRFTAEHGYLVESKRGGSGYIRILRVAVHSKNDLLNLILEQIGDNVTQMSAEHIIYRMLDEDIITIREASIMQSVIKRASLPLSLPLRDELRAHLLQAMIQTIKLEKM